VKNTGMVGGKEVGGGGQYKEDWFVHKSLEVKEYLVKAKYPPPPLRDIYTPMSTHTYIYIPTYLYFYLAKGWP